MKVKSFFNSPEKRPFSLQNGIFLFLIQNKVSKKRSILDPLQDQKKSADPDPITCDPGSRVHDPDPEAVIPDPIYLVTTLASRFNAAGDFTLARLFVFLDYP